MTIDEMIEALQRAKEKIGGSATLWVNCGGNQGKWEETQVIAAETVNDGESVYVRFISKPEEAKT